MIKSIPLANLVASENNVRRASDPAADAQLSVDIAAHGLLQNLVVTPARPRGRFAVEAGGRRLRALLSLQSEGVLPADHKVACLVLGERDDAVAASEASLAENLQRLAMNPADECLAFGRLIEQGADVEGVARRFGLTTRHVEGRLRLADLHPAIFEALGAGEITLDAAKAYAVTSDQERQLWVFDQLSSGWSGAHPDTIRRMMVSATVPANDRRMRFVGEEAYLAAGGRLERDLFAEAEDARVLDVPILDQLAMDKLEVEAAWLAKEHGFAFVRASLDVYVQPWQHEDICRAHIDLPGRSEKERSEVDAIESEIDRLVRLLEDENADDFAREEGEARIAELEAQMREIAARPPVLCAETRGKVGFFLLLDEAGAPRLDRTPYALAGQDEGEGSGGEAMPEGDAEGATKRSDRQSGSGRSISAAGSAERPEMSKLPQRLIDELAMQRRDVLALHVARDPELAFDLAVFLMVKDEGCYCYESARSSLSARSPSDPVLRSQMPAAPVQALLAEADNGLDRSWAGHESLAAKFDAFRALPRAAREAWLGAAVAGTLEASAGAAGRQCAFHDHLGALLGIDVARHWRPTALNWFDRVPKALCLAALTEVGGPELAARHSKAKKAEIAEACEKVFAGEAIVPAEVIAAALAWVPEPMRFAAPDTGENAEEVELSDGTGQPGVAEQADVTPPVGGGEDACCDEGSPPWVEDEVQGPEPVDLVTSPPEVDGQLSGPADGGVVDAGEGAGDEDPEPPAELDRAA